MFCCVTYCSLPALPLLVEGLQGCPHKVCNCVILLPPKVPPFVLVECSLLMKCTTIVLFLLQKECTSNLINQFANTVSDPNEYFTSLCLTHSAPPPSRNSKYTSAPRMLNANPAPEQTWLQWSAPATCDSKLCLPFQLLLVICSSSSTTTTEHC